jgi:hypothetical protein
MHGKMKKGSFPGTGSMKCPGIMCDQANSERQINYNYQNKITSHLLKSNTDRVMG